MIEDQFLNYFITEDIYQLPDEPLISTRQVQTSATPAILEEPQPELVQQEIYPLAIWTPPLTTKDRELLTNILKAVKEDISNAHIMEGLAAYHPHYKKLLCFGYQKELELKLSTTFQLYRPTKTSDKQVLLSVTPLELHDNGAEKKQLWNALKEMFLS